MDFKKPEDKGEPIDDSSGEGAQTTVHLDGEQVPLSEAYQRLRDEHESAQDRIEDLETTVGEQGEVIDELRSRVKENAEDIGAIDERAASIDAQVRTNEAWTDRNAEAIDEHEKALDAMDAPAESQ